MSEVKHMPVSIRQCENTPSLIEDEEGNIFIKVTEIYDGSVDKERISKMWANAATLVRCWNAWSDKDALRIRLAELEA